MLSIVVAGMILAGNGTLANISAGTTGFAALGGVMTVLLGFLVQASTEEILFRGFLLPVLSSRTKVWIGVLVNTTIFALLHVMNPDTSILAVINTFLWGLFTSIWVLNEGSLWGVMAWHTAWNWAQSNVFGLNTSGQDVIGGTIFDFEFSGQSWLGGNTYGPEATIFCTIVLLVGIGIILLSLRKKRLALKYRGIN